jgi:hypothetical protein
VDDVIRAAVVAFADALPIPSPWDLHEFVDSVADEQRPIFLLPTDTHSSVCGLWIATDRADYIAYEQRTSGPHRDHIVVHEVGHLALGHHGRLERSPGARYADTQEQQAELFAARVLQRASRRTPRPAPPSDDLHAVLSTFAPQGRPHDRPRHPALVFGRRLRRLGSAAHPN